MIFIAYFIALVIIPHDGNSAPRKEISKGTWTVAFDNTDIIDVIKFVDEVNGRTYVVHPAVHGKVRVFSKESIGLDKINTIFTMVLKNHGYEILEKNGIFNIVPNTHAVIEKGMPN